MTDKFERIAKLIYKHLIYELTTEEAVELNGWIAENEGHQAIFERMTDRDMVKNEYSKFIQFDDNEQIRIISNRLYSGHKKWKRYAVLVKNMFSGFYLRK